MAEDDVADAERIDLAGEQASHDAEPAADVEQERGAGGLHEDGGLVALRIERAAGAQEDDAGARHGNRG